MTDRIGTRWHAMPALPVGPETHAYFALRRVWGDHTMAAARGFYNPSSEDHATVALFQSLVTLSNGRWVKDLGARIGLDLPPADRVRVAYACEEIVDARLQARHGRNFVIADIVLRWEGAGRSGLFAFEAKKPGGPMPSVQDAAKLASYADLSSMRAIPERAAAFLIDDRHVPAVRRAGHPALGWSEARVILLAGLKRESPLSVAQDFLVNETIALYARFGVGGTRPFSLPATPSLSDLRALGLPPALEHLGCGLVISAATASGRPPAVSPYAWLEREPEIAAIRAGRFQSTAERRINRWSFDWSPRQEPRWPFTR